MSSKIIAKRMFFTFFTLLIVYLIGVGSSKFVENRVFEEESINDNTIKEISIEDTLIDY